MENNKLSLLAVDDHANIIDMLRLELGDRVDFVGVTTAAAALALIDESEFDIVLTDYNFQENLNGLEIFRRARRKNSFITVCLMTGDEASSKMKEVFETFDGMLIEKPFPDGALDKLLERAQLNATRRAEFQRADQKLSNDPFADIVSETPVMNRVLDQVRQTTKKRAVIPIHMAGPTGCGKSMIAKAIHESSGARGKLVVVNCASLTDTPDSKLFGHKRGSFTGAIADHTGIIELVNGGTLFLDEFHLLPKEVQGKLLRVLQDGFFQRLGDNQERHSTFRLITASSVDIKKLADEGQFMIDLWFRVAGVTIKVPALAERRACIPKLIYRELKRIGDRDGNQYEIAPDAMGLMTSFSWSGNVRDLNHSLEAMCLQIDGDGVIDRAMVTQDLAGRLGNFDGVTTVVEKLQGNLKEVCRRFEIGLIVNALRDNKNNLLRTANALGLPRETLRARILSLGIQR